MSSRITVAEYVAKFLVDHGICQCFCVTGGGSIFLNDAIGNYPDIKTVFVHHEQAAAMAAEGYARVTNKPALVLVTTGPGGLNALTGVWGAHVDSIPMLVISGQVKRATCMAFVDCHGLRQLGDQEIDIVKVVREHVAKYAVVVREPKEVHAALESALHYATTGRQGPAWIDIPIDVQSALVDPDAMPAPIRGRTVTPDITRQAELVVDRLRLAERPVVLAGSGVRLSGAVELLRSFCLSFGIPVTTAWTAHDLIPTDHPCCAGRPGTVGDRAGNFVVQSSDLLLVLGSRLNLRQVSYNWENFAPKAFKIQVDIDSFEMRKPTVRPDLPIVADVREFLVELTRQLDRECRTTNFDVAGFGFAKWLAWCRERVREHPVVTEKMRKTSNRINPYVFIETLFDCLDEDDVVICGDGTACVVPFQVGKIREHTRMWTNSGCAAMGYDLPAAIGAAFARGGKRVICLAGDGSIMLNLQELQTIAQHRLNVKIFVLNNDGYLSIRQTQDNFFGRRTGEGPSSGLAFPDFVKVGQAFGIKTADYYEGTNLRNRIHECLSINGPTLVDVQLDPTQPFEPKISTRRNDDGTMTSATLEDMAPFLPREDLERNMIR